MMTNPDFYFQTKSRNAFSDIGSGFKSLVGGELKGLSKLTRDLRNELIFEAMQQVSMEFIWTPSVCQFLVCFNQECAK